MSKLDQFEYDVLRAVFNAQAITNISASGGSTQVWLGLHTADPGDSGTTSAEGGYAAYTRIGVDRTTAGWNVSTAGSASPSSAISFPTVATTSTGTFTHATVYTSSSISSSGGLYNGAISPTINFGNGVTPMLTTASAITEA